MTPELQALLQATLAAEAEALAARIRTSLSGAPGGDHRLPWRQSGDLAGSIGVTAGPEGVVVGSAAAVALVQELGSQHVPPRPFLAPAAAAAAAGIGQAVAAAAATHLHDLFGRR